MFESFTAHPWERTGLWGNQGSPCSSGRRSGVHRLIGVQADALALALTDHPELRAPPPRSSGAAIAFEILASWGGYVPKYSLEERSP